MTSHPTTPYQVRLSRTATRALTTRLPEKVATAAYEFISGPLRDNPHRVGKQLKLEPYAGTWSARRGGYRVLYEIDDELGHIDIVAVEHRADVYRSR